jgi:fructose/tagatose bisphosphate aldolase
MTPTVEHARVEHARELMERCRREHFAVGAFNVDNQETLLAIARAARAKRTPVLVELSHGEVEVIGLANMRWLVDSYRGAGGERAALLPARRGDRRRQGQHQLRPALRLPHDARAPAERSPDEYAIVKLIGPVIGAVQDVVEQRIDVFGAAGRARP